MKNLLILTLSLFLLVGCSKTQNKEISEKVPEINSKEKVRTIIAIRNGKKVDKDI